MRKYLVGLTIAVIFVAYSIVLRHQHSEPVIAPAGVAQNNSNTSTTPSQSNPSSSQTNTATTTTNQSTNSPSSNTNNTNTTATTPSSKYKDGTYTGSVENAFYGNVQIATVIQNGQITAVNFLEYPNENPNSQYVNQQAIPYLKQEAIKAQGSNVSIVTGATFTSQAFIQSLASALSQAM